MSGMKRIKNDRAFSYSAKNTAYWRKEISKEGKTLLIFQNPDWVTDPKKTGHTIKSEANIATQHLRHYINKKKSCPQVEITSQEHQIIFCIPLITEEQYVAFLDLVSQEDQMSAHNMTEVLKKMTSPIAATSSDAGGGGSASPSDDSRDTKKRIGKPKLLKQSKRQSLVFLGSAVTGTGEKATAPFGDSPGLGAMTTPPATPTEKDEEVKEIERSCIAWLEEREVRLGALSLLELKHDSASTLFLN